MNRVSFLMICFVIAGMVTACSPSPSNQIQEELDRTPDWYMNPPADNDEFLYAVSSGVSSRREVARQKAQANARTNMSQKLEVKVEALEKIFTEEITSGSESNFSESFTNASKSITSQTLRGFTADQIHFEPTEDGRYECFILARLPVGDARAALDNALSQEEELYVKFKESKAFEEFQNDLDRLGENN